MRKTVTVKYELGHSYDFIYETTDLYCPSCGKQNVWCEQGDGDFYEGPNHVCTNCCASFTIPSLSSDNNKDDQIVKQLK